MPTMAQSNYRRQPIYDTASSSDSFSDSDSPPGSVRMYSMPTVTCLEMLSTPTKVDTLTRKTGQRPFTSVLSRLTMPQRDASPPNESDEVNILEDLLKTLSIVNESESVVPASPPIASSTESSRSRGSPTESPRSRGSPRAAKAKSSKRINGAGKTVIATVGRLNFGEEQVPPLVANRVPRIDTSPVKKVLKSILRDTTNQAERKVLRKVTIVTPTNSPDKTSTVPERVEGAFNFVVKKICSSSSSESDLNSSSERLALAEANVGQGLQYVVKEVHRVPDVAPVASSDSVELIASPPTSGTTSAEDLYWKIRALIKEKQHLNIRDLNREFTAKYGYAGEPHKHGLSWAEAVELPLSQDIRLNSQGDIFMKC